MRQAVDEPMNAGAELRAEIDSRRSALAEVEEALRRWEEATANTPQRENADFETISGREVQPVYSPVDRTEFDYTRDLGMPGEFPFTRGPYHTMYRTRLWTKRLFAGFATAAETNERYKFLLERGQTGLSVAFDFPTLMGYDSDDPLSEGEVGKCGVAISSLADMEMLFDGIPLDRVSVSMTINGPAIMLYCFLLVAAEKQGVSFDQVRGTIQNDILKEYMAQHAWIFPPRPALKVITDIFEWSAAHAPRFNTISISGYHIREAGATAGQELAFTLKNGFTYVEEGIGRGLDIDEFAPPESWRLRTHAQTAGVSLTAQQPHNNIVRVAYQALAAVLGGTQSLHTNAMDETLALPTESAVRIALRTQQILAFETGVPNSIDPLAGSYFVEALTDGIEQEAEEIFAEIDELGGVVQGIESGYFQARIAASARRFQDEIETGRRTIVGVNEFREDGEAEVDIEILRIDESAGELQRKRLAELRANRDQSTVDEALSRLSAAAREGTNLMPPLLDATRAYVTLGEMRSALVDVYGQFKEPVGF